MYLTTGHGKKHFNELVIDGIKPTITTANFFECYEKDPFNEIDL